MGQDLAARLVTFASKTREQVPESGVEKGINGPEDPMTCPGANKLDHTLELEPSVDSVPSLFVTFFALF